jgi:hypothetical protein
MEIYEKLICGLANIEIGDTLLFGVFGEPFADPLLEERIALTKRLRPDLQIDIASNGELASPERVAGVIDHVRRISIHIEASSPDLYDKLMVPLKAAKVFPNIDVLIRRFGAKITITTPLHQANLHDVPRLKQRWIHHGINVDFLSLQTRTTEKTLAKRVNLGATGGFWSADLIDILVVDWDGMVLATCDDFLRRQPLGDLRQDSVKKIMEGAPRRSLFDALRGHRWHQLPSLKDAIVDDSDITRAFSAVTPIRARWTIYGLQLLGGPGSRKVADGIMLGMPNSLDEALVFGPYLDLPVGRYHARFRGTSVRPADDLGLVFEVAADMGARRHAAVERYGQELASLDVTMEFTHRDPASLLEFRIFALSGDPSATLLHSVQLTRLNAMN